MFVTGRLAAALVALAALTLAAPAATLPVGVLLAAAVAADVAAAAAPARLQVTRSVPSRVRRGEPLAVAFRIVHTGRRTARVRLHDCWPPSVGGQRRCGPLTVPPGSAAEAGLTLLPRRAGRRGTDAVVLRCAGPLGLAGRQRRRPLPADVLVGPAFPSARRLPVLLATAAAGGDLTVRGRGGSSDVDGLHVYAPGDDPRAIDWRATARSAAVLARTYRPERERPVLLVLDTGRTSAGRLTDDRDPDTAVLGTRLDAALDAAQLLAAVARRAGDRVGVLAYDRQLRVDLPVGRGGLGADPGRLSAALAGLSPALVDTDMPGLVSAVLPRLGQRGLVVLFTDPDPAVLSPALVRALGLLGSRHEVCLGAVRDPQRDAWAAAVELAPAGAAPAGPGRSSTGPDAAAVFAAAAAAQVTAGRATAAAALRAVRITVVERPPAELGAAVTAHYLGLKRHGRL